MAMFIVTCKTCKAVRRVTPTLQGERGHRTYTLEGVTLWRSQTGWLNVPCTCGGTLLGKVIQGSFSNQPCSPKCTSATGFVCECTCNGANHGGKYAA
jgi:hypothetical protein